MANKYFIARKFPSSNKEITDFEYLKLFFTIFYFAFIEIASKKLLRNVFDVEV